MACCPVVLWCFLTLFYGQSGSLNHCRNFDLDVSTANASIRWRCLFPTPTTFAVKQRGVSGNRLISFKALDGVLAPEQIEFDAVWISPTARRTGLANTFAEHVNLRSSNLESTNNSRCVQILKNIAQSWHITKRCKKHQKVSINCVDMLRHSAPEGRTTKHHKNIKHFISKTPIVSIMRLQSIPKKTVPLGFLRRWIRRRAPLRDGGGRSFVPPQLLHGLLRCLCCLGLCQASLLGTWEPKTRRKTCENTEIWEDDTLNSCRNSEYIIFISRTGCTNSGLTGS